MSKQIAFAFDKPRIAQPAPPWPPSGISWLYSDAAVAIACADCRDILPRLGAIDCCLTDPPYSETTHAGAMTSKGGDGAHTLVDFASFTETDLRQVFSLIGVLTRRWTISFMDYHHVVAFENDPPPGLRFVRFGIWCKLGTGAPQFSGDRPGVGWEAIGIFHRPEMAMQWNGRGIDSVFHEHTMRGGYPTEKPLKLVRKLVSLFTDPGELILDPFCGSGTTLRAAADLGRRAIGIDKSKESCEIAIKKMAQAVLPLNSLDALR